MILFPPYLSRCSHICCMALIVALPSLSGCTVMSSSGPSTGRIERSGTTGVVNSNIQIIEMSAAVAQQLLDSSHTESFASVFGDVAPSVGTIGRGDTLDITIWEAPPAVLFGSTIADASSITSYSVQPTRNTTLPEQMVGQDGLVTVPFVGQVKAVARAPADVAREIVRRLQGLAHQPQAVVRVVKNLARTVTVVGDVANSQRIPITAKGERLLDAIAAAGGVKQAVTKMTVQITRGSVVLSQPLEAIVTDARQNIVLQPDDVVTVYYQPYSFTALGATGLNSELPFEGTGLTLAQALGRAGGLNDQRASAKGVFIFRLENPAMVHSITGKDVPATPDGKVPVIYHVDLRDPATFFLAQSFQIRNRDILYASNAPMADLQKFVNIVSSIVIPAITVQNSTK